MATHAPVPTVPRFVSTSPPKPQSLMTMLSSFRIQVTPDAIQKGFLTFHWSLKECWPVVPSVPQVADRPLSPRTHRVDASPVLGHKL